MASKRMRTYGSSLATSYSLSFFLSSVINPFQLILCKEKSSQILSLLKWFVEVILKCLISNIYKEMFFSLVRMIYSNLKYIGGILTSDVKKHQIWLSLENFAEICKLLCIGSKFEAEGTFILICLLLFLS